MLDEFSAQVAFGAFVVLRRVRVVDAEIDTATRQSQCQKR